MTYSDDVRSVRSADRIELFRFDGPQVTYAYASGTRGLTYDAISYTPLDGLRRSATGSTSSGDKRTLTVTMSGDCDLATDYAYGTPPRTLRLRVYEYQRRSTEAVLIWDGDVTDVRARGTELEVRSASRAGSDSARPTV